MSESSSPHCSPADSVGATLVKMVLAHLGSDASDLQIEDILHRPNQTPVNAVGWPTDCREVIDADSADSALEILKNHADQFPKSCLFRGEPRFYSASNAAIYRLSIDLCSRFYAGLNPNLASHLSDHLLRKHLVSTCGILTYNGEPFGADDLADPGGDMEPRNVSWGFYGLMQHYGIPTDWIDLTRCPEVAVYFASQGPQDECGYVYFGDVDAFYDNGRVIDVAAFAKQLRSIVPMDETRPEKQKALAVRLHKLSNLRSLLKCLRFRKTNTYHDLQKHYFPPDAIKTWLMGQVVDYRLDYRQRAASFYGNRKEGEIDEHDQSLGTMIEYLNL